MKAPTEFEGERIPSPIEFEAATFAETILPQIKLNGSTVRFAIGIVVDVPTAFEVMSLKFPW